LSLFGIDTEEEKDDLHRKLQVWGIPDRREATIKVDYMIVQNGKRSKGLALVNRMNDK
jgi:hypothetical protein